MRPTDSTGPTDPVGTRSEHSAGREVGDPGDPRSLPTGRSLRVAITGSSGLVGSALAGRLTRERHRVVPLVRRACGSGEVRWDPEGGWLDTNAMEGLDAVVHLAGEPIGRGRWTRARKARIRESRVKGTAVLCEGLARLKNPPPVLVSASAIGWYGNGGERVLDERSPAGMGFLPEVCGAWERATEPARAAGLRVVHLRIGMIVSAKGGALARMLTPFRLGLGGPIGSGEQFVSWIGLEDLLGVIEWVLGDSRLCGAVNATSPEPVRQREFARALGRVLRRPAVTPMPGVFVRMAFGEMGEALLLEGARVSPAKLVEAGFHFEAPELEKALRAELGS